MIAGLSILSGCNQANRGNDSNLGEDRDEAAAESNTDKFAGKRERDAEFVYEIVESNYGEIKLAELGHQKSRNAEVKKIAQTFLTDHSTSLNELKTLAQAKAISVPVEEREQSKQMLEDLGAEGDADFDQAWCEEMIDMHDESIDKF